MHFLGREQIPLPYSKSVCMHVLAHLRVSKSWNLCLHFLKYERIGTGVAAVHINTNKDRSSPELSEKFCMYSFLLSTEKGALEGLTLISDCLAG